MGIFNWTCPYCNRDTTITDSNHDIKEEHYNNGNKEGWIIIQTTMIACPNPVCKEYAVSAKLFKAEISAHGAIYKIGTPLYAWRLKPSSSAKPVPDYIPSPIVSDYEEACLIRDFSPKASATLSRRCLQGMIRDFFSVHGRTLFDEIDAIKDRIDSSTWDAIKAVKDIGNIGAHMERDINVIVDVEPEEAQLLIGLIEMLIKDWYIARHDREERMRGLVALAASKKPAN